MLNGTIDGKKFAWAMVSEEKNQEPRNNVELVKLLILPNSQKRNAVEVESLIPYVSPLKLTYYNFISSICAPELGKTFFVQQKLKNNMQP